MPFTPRFVTLYAGKYNEMQASVDIFSRRGCWDESIVKVEGASKVVRTELVMSVRETVR